jgi:biotin operon repressor
MKIIINCDNCGKTKLKKNEIGICKKLLGEKITKFFCIKCLADYLNVTENDINDKIEQFKEDGCKLFE